MINVNGELHKPNSGIKRHMANANMILGKKTEGSPENMRSTKNLFRDTTDKFNQINQSLNQISNMNNISQNNKVSLANKYDFSNMSQNSINTSMDKLPSGKKLPSGNANRMQKSNNSSKGFSNFNNN